MAEWLVLQQPGQSLLEHAMSTIRLIITDYPSREPEIRQVRDEVFVIEQQIARHDELDDRDVSCLHTLAYENDKPVATGRLDVEKDGKIGRIAVLKAYRRRGIGTRVMESLVQAAREQGLRRIWFHSQISAVPFYLRMGYQASGEEFEEAGIPHVLMERWLVEGEDGKLLADIV